jgi:hypothetical protein
MSHQQISKVGNYNGVTTGESTGSVTCLPFPNSTFAHQKNFKQIVTLYIKNK